MRIGIMSDSHGEYESVKRAVNTMRNVDLILHGGDNYNDAEKLRKEINVEIIGVKGNTDFLIHEPSEKIIEIHKRKIFLTHGHKYDVKSDLNRLYYRASELNADIVVFGHSHIPIYLEESNIVFINPGSTSRPRGGSRPSIAILELKNNDIKVELIDME